MFSFPSFRQLFPHSMAFGSDYLKFEWRCNNARAEIAAFERFVNADSFRQQFFELFTSSSYPIIHSFLDKRFSKSERLEAMQYDLEQAQRLFNQEILASFLSPTKYRLAELNDDLSIYLNRNDLCPNEGWWAVSLRNQAGQRLYTATFAFVKNEKMLITSIQGPAGEDAKDIVRHLTKTLYGLRPQQLMLIVLQNLTHIFKQQALLGIAQENHIKTRFRFKKRYLLNYDQFWQDIGASKQADGYWYLPMQNQHKDLADIESKKRSMYRKRYAMLDSLITNIQAAFQTSNLSKET